MISSFIGFGSKPFIEIIKEALGFRATGRSKICAVAVPMNYS